MTDTRQVITTRGMGLNSYQPPTIHRLDCGHDSTPSKHLAGYAYDTDLHITMCYECSALNDVKHLNKFGRVGAYMSGDGSALTTFTGITLGFVTQRAKSRTGWHQSEIVCWQGVMLDGKTKVYGRGTGPGFFTTIRKMKGGRKK